MGKALSKNKGSAAFRVGFLNQKGIVVGKGTITISRTKLEFISKSKKQEYEWPLTTISRYGSANGTFTFEAVDSNEQSAMYCFTSSKTDRMEAFLDQKVQEYQKKQEKN
ncbi:hypothetical protein TrispH2_010716 [Trichoplax sp. H2]|nr:hypothetical protein TrispH2_010716 [Trichoplax sp. H2]|eukprot:RDD36941.1 hypothetical protein TrispH2_010716 [Trichoplax sp. H2]